MIAFINFSLTTIKSKIKSFIRFYKTKLIHQNAIYEQSIHNLQQDAIKFKEFLREEIKSLKNEKN
jgi:hypothetical protein